jgi:hypothetical protein
MAWDMVNVRCRDCGRLGDEDPDDPAPGLCPSCYETRLQRITPLFNAECGKLRGTDITPAIIWLANALEEIGGETRAYARKHADSLAWSLVLQSRLN